MREHDFIERTQISLTSWNTLKINSRTNRGTSEGSETSADEYSTSRIQFCVVCFCLGIIWKVILKKKRSKIHFTKIDQADLDSPHRELSNGGLGIVVALTFFSGIIFCLLVLGVQSSCRLKTHSKLICQCRSACRELLLAITQKPSELGVNCS